MSGASEAYTNDSLSFIFLYFLLSLMTNTGIIFVINCTCLLFVDFDSVRALLMHTSYARLSLMSW
jgi:hypothetical protein